METATAESSEINNDDALSPETDTDSEADTNTLAGMGDTSLPAILGSMSILATAIDIISYLRMRKEK